MDKVQIHIRFRQEAAVFDYAEGDDVTKFVSFDESAVLGIIANMEADKDHGDQKASLFRLLTENARNKPGEWTTASNESVANGQAAIKL